MTFDWVAAALALALPLHFEPNPGGTAFVAAAGSYRLRLDEDGMALGALRMRLPRRSPEGVDRLPGHSNYYGGAERRTGVPQYARVRYRALYRGVDLEVYGKDGRIEYDWLVAPGADPAAIRFRFRGASRMRVDANGDLVLETAAGEVRHQKPYAYQPGGGEVASGFVLGPRGAVGFHVGKYDHARPLVIDPTLVYAVGFGGSGGSDTGTGIAVDGSGNVYVAGNSLSSDFPMLPAACVGCQAAFVAKLSADGSRLLYATYLTTPRVVGVRVPPVAIAVDAGGNAYVTGATNGASFPSAAGGTLATAGGSDAFVAKLDPSGKLAGSLLLGGSADDAGTSIALGPDSRLYVAGTTQSSDFGISPGAYRINPSGHDVFLAKINPAFLFGPLLYASVLGPGTGPVVSADSAGDALVAVGTTSTVWASSTSAAQGFCGGTSCADVVVAKMNPAGTVLLATTYLGGSGVETAAGIGADGGGNVYVAGTTASTDFPVTAGAFQAQWTPPQTGATSAFAVKLTPELSKLLYATYLHGDQADTAQALVVDAAGDAYVGGSTSSPGFPIVNGFQTTLYNSICPVFTPSGGTPSGERPCVAAGFVSLLNPGGSALTWSSYAGSNSVPALALDAAGNLYATGAGTGGIATALGGSPSASVGVLKIAPRGQPLQISRDSLTNGASFTPGLPHPGGLASLFVHGLPVTGTVSRPGYPLPTELVKLSLTVGGVPAPLLSVTNIPVSNPLGLQQINFQVPFEAQSNLVEVLYQGVPTIVVPPPSAPGIFLMPDGSGAIQHASDYSLVTAANPAKPGEDIVVYTTGLGPVDPPAPTGSPAAAAGVMKSSCAFSTSFGMPAYAGVTPGFVGLYQLNLKVPAAASPGTADLQLTMYCWMPSLIPDSYVVSNTVKVPIQ